MCSLSLLYIPILHHFVIVLYCAICYIICLIICLFIELTYSQFFNSNVTKVHSRMFLASEHFSVTNILLIFFFLKIVKKTKTKTIYKNTNIALLIFFVLQNSTTIDKMCNDCHIFFRSMVGGSNVYCKCIYTSVIIQQLPSLSSQSHKCLKLSSLLFF